jgi:hypothetical protein
VVTDLEAARSRLLERGVQVGKIRHKPHWSVGRKFRARARPEARRLCQLRQFFRSGW